MYMRDCDGNWVVTDLRPYGDRAQLSQAGQPWPIYVTRPGLVLMRTGCHLLCLFEGADRDWLDN